MSSDGEKEDRNPSDDIAESIERMNALWKELGESMKRIQETLAPLKNKEDEGES